MKKSFLIKSARIINEQQDFIGDILIKNGRITKITTSIDAQVDEEINAEGLIAMPGVIDDQVHFREPGLTHKANLYTEPRAAVAGGTTTYMEMPNTKPAALTQELLEDKYQIAATNSLANYSFFMGASNDNIEEVLKTDMQSVCGVKIFMGSSTGNMLVDNEKTLEGIFSQSPMLIATHCEDEQTIRRNAAIYKEKYGEEVPIDCHPEIRNIEGCYLSSSLAVRLAQKHNSRLHILHISTVDELDLFRNDIPLEEKRITAEVCVHHLHFTADDYARLGTQIKCNPAIKAAHHKAGIWEGLLDNRLDIIATDHAPHTWEEKSNTYFKAPSGVPLVQHSLTLMMQYVHEGRLDWPFLIHKMCHAPAICFQVKERGYLREDYWADIILIDPEQKWQVEKSNILHKCNWSPFEGETFRGQVAYTFVNGHLAYQNGILDETLKGKRLEFNRD